MSDEKPKKVSVTALKYHTNGDKEYHMGETYDVPETEVGNLVAQGMAKPSADVKQDAKDAKQEAKDAKAAERDARDKS